ncbi:nitroreductase family protein [Candidatus Acetothermia bacterium]|nr:nitroreductase family protein [Candidatus Acetothermia bacterium]MCI2427721.1 nitroreductase family protein [Candidatus Acetothermia bacterium]MCI2428029.1 nitroreductase family protein [Candidatus Acetothermia bacterium]
MMNDTLKTIFDRRSIRSFIAERKIEPEKLELIIKAALAAPSAGNAQPWKFYILDSVELKQQAVAAAYGQSFIAQAPVLIVVCADLQIATTAYGYRGDSLYAYQDTAAAVQNILLAAKSLGLETCWIGAFDENVVARKILRLPKHLRPVAMIPIGYSDEVGKPRPKRPRDEVIEWRS